MNKTNVLTLIIFVLFVLLAIILLRFFVPESIISNSDKDIVEFNDFVFFKNSAGLWDFDVKNMNSNELYTVTLRKLPTDVEYIETVGDVSTFYKHKNNINLVFNPELSSTQKSSFGLSMIETTLTLSRVFSVNISSACRTYDSSCKQMAEECNSAKVPLIEFIYSDKPKIELVNNNCLLVHGDEETIFDSTEKLIYTWYKILE